MVKKRLPKTEEMKKQATDGEKKVALKQKKWKNRQLIVKERLPETEEMRNWATDSENKVALKLKTDKLGNH